MPESCVRSSLHDRAAAGAFSLSLQMLARDGKAASGNAADCHYSHEVTSKNM